MSDEKVRQRLQEKLSQHYPGEELRGYLTAGERLNPWLEFFLLGPIAGAFGAGNYYFGLTDKRIMLIQLSPWTGGPTDEVSEIILGRITKIEHIKGWLTGKLNLSYGNIKRKFTVHWQQRENAKRFVEALELLPKQPLTDEEERIAIELDKAYEQERQERTVRAIVVFVILLIVILGLNFSNF